MPYIPKVRRYYGGFKLLTYAVPFTDSPLFPFHALEGNPIYQNADVSVALSGSSVFQVGDDYVITDTFNISRSHTFSRIKPADAVYGDGNLLVSQQPVEVIFYESEGFGYSIRADPKKQAPSFSGLYSFDGVIGERIRTGTNPSTTNISGSISLSPPEFYYSFMSGERELRNLLRLALNNNVFSQAITPSTAAEWRDLRLLGTQSGVAYEDEGNPNDTRQYAWSWRIY